MGGGVGSDGMVSDLNFSGTGSPARRYEQLDIRGDGTIPAIKVEADNLSEAIHYAILKVYEGGARVETPKHTPGMTLGYDAEVKIRVRNPIAEPRVHKLAVVEDGRGVMQQILEVTHGIHNHWLKCPEHPEWWGYTYNGRFVKQIPFVLARIKHDWDTKGRMTGRDYHFATWRPEEDVVLEQDDPPCLQTGTFRFLLNNKGEWVMNYQTRWRSRCEVKAWNQNNLGQTEFMRLFGLKVQDMLGIPIKLGSYTDDASSLHIYGLYVDRDHIEKAVIRRLQTESPADLGVSLDDYFEYGIDGGTAVEMKRLVAAQMDAEAKGQGLNQPKKRLEELGYDLSTFPYPADWDSWPKEWDLPADPEMLRKK